MSAKGFWITQDGHVANVIPPKSAGAAVAGTRFNLAEWAHASILLHFGVSGGPIGAITLNVYEAQTGGSGVAIGYRLFKQEATSTPFDVFGGLTLETSAGYTPGTDEANAMYVLEVDAADVLAAANGTYLELDIAVGSLGTTAQLLAAVAILSAGRNTSDQSPSVQV
ncbi:MAG: hypothetical protein WA708_18175 [Acidobacteriaceae bacterium]